MPQALNNANNKEFVHSIEGFADSDEEEEIEEKDEEKEKDEEEDEDDEEEQNDMVER